MVDIELGEDLLRQVEVMNGPLPEDVKTKGLKFDAKGTLHMMCRNEDGKLLKDVVVKNVDVQPSYNEERLKEYEEEHEIIALQNRRSNFLISAVIGVLVLLCITVVACITYMR